MGVLPLQYPKGVDRNTLKLTGEERFDILVGDDLTPGQEVTVRARCADGTVQEFKVICRIDTPVEIDYYRNGGIMQTVLRRILKQG
jgi:aconitate hydratase